MRFSDMEIHEAEGLPDGVILFAFQPSVTMPRACGVIHSVAVNHATDQLSGGFFMGYMVGSIINVVEP